MSQIYKNANSSGDVATTYVTNSGSSTPVDFIENVLGEEPAITTTGSGNTITISTLASMIFIASSTVNGAPSVQFKNLPDIYNTFIVLLSNILPNNDGDNLGMQVSTNNGVSYINTGYLSGINTQPYNSATATNDNSTTFIEFASTAAHLGSPQGNFFLKLSNVTNDGQLSVTGTGTYLIMNGTVNMAIIGGCYNTNAVINAIQFIASTGNIGGTFSLYGIAGA